MNKFLDLRLHDFRLVSEAKARLSELVRRLTPGSKRIVITTNGKPSAVILSYQDYLDLMSEVEEQEQR